MSEKIIEITNLDYAYPDGTKALNNISLDIEEGDSVGIIGPNGAGKSTLLLHLNGILGKGERVKIAGTDITKKNLTKIRKMVGVVFQEPDNQLFMPTVFDDVAFGPLNMDMSEEEVKLAVNNTLSEVDMLHTRDRVSHHLSFGEKKRISIATVLSMSPKIIALDEPSSNLDPKHRYNLIGLLREIKRTKVIVTHDLDLVSKVSSRVVVMDGGQVVADGETGKILADKALLERHSLLFN